jgi:hypothetical protein
MDFTSDYSIAVAVIGGGFGVFLFRAVLPVIWEELADLFPTRKPNNKTKPKQ